MCVYIYIYVLCFAVRLSFASMRSLISSVAFFTRHFCPLYMHVITGQVEPAHTL